MAGDFAEREEKAAYNQSGNITEMLGKLLGNYIYSMNTGQFDQAVKSIDRIHDIISAKIKEEESSEVDGLVTEICNELLEAMETYEHKGGIYIKDPEKRTEVYNKIKKLFRMVNKLQDKYGYGMASLDDPRFAVLQK